MDNQQLELTKTVYEMYGLFQLELLNGTKHGKFFTQDEYMERYARITEFNRLTKRILEK